ncbi:MAG: hypothetical protein QHH19_00745 [Candidatus Thermoplasmatota archaeon]|jgi:hypothetical protein|nr:hypothetical protein [Candidatus Thermoplasmatota archaeon]
MIWKKILKPDWKKILLTVIILLPALLISYNEPNCMTMGGGCTHSEGFPFVYHSIHHPAALPNPPQPTEYFNYFFIVLDVIFWYLISCVIIFLFYKIRKK